MQVAATLATMQHLGFAHLDVKPANILVSRRQHLTFKLGDFGLAARLDGAFAIEEGDRQYISAELLAGNHSNLCAADIFSLGLSLYELASGAELPHEGAQYESLRRNGPPRLESCSEALNDTIAVRLLRPCLLKSSATLSCMQRDTHQSDMFCHYKWVKRCARYMSSYGWLSCLSALHQELFVLFECDRPLCRP